MEELLLRLLLAGDELYIVHQQQRRLPVFLAELPVLSLADGGDQLVCEVVALDVDDARLGLPLFQQVRDGVEQVRLAEAGVAVDKQRVVVLGRALGHGARRGIGELVLRADDVGFKREAVGVCEVARMVGRHAVVGGELLVVKELDLKIRRKNVPQRVFDIAHEAGLDRIFLEAVAAVQNKGGVLHRHHADLVEPGADGRLRQLLCHVVEHILPDVRQ